MIYFIDICLMFLYVTVIKIPSSIQFTIQRRQVHWLNKYAIEAITNISIASRKYGRVQRLPKYIFSYTCGKYRTITIYYFFEIQIFINHLKKILMLKSILTRN